MYVATEAELLLELPQAGIHPYFFSSVERVRNPAISMIIFCSAGGERNMDPKRYFIFDREFFHREHTAFVSKK